MNIHKSPAAYSLPKLLLALTLFTVLFTAALTFAQPAPAPDSREAYLAAIKEEWGVEIVALRETSGGYMLDFRYRIADPEKALPLMNRELKPFLIDQETRKQYQVPNSPKVGALRATSAKPIKGRTYYVLFSNPGNVIPPGRKATVVIGDLRIENLVVE